MNPIDSLQQVIDIAVEHAVDHVKDDPDFIEDITPVTYSNVTRQVTLEMTVGASVLCGDDLKVNLRGVHPAQAVSMIEDTIRREVEGEREAA
jgi:hypothetical protein